MYEGREVLDLNRSDPVTIKIELGGGTRPRLLKQSISEEVKDSAVRVSGVWRDVKLIVTAMLMLMALIFPETSTLILKLLLL